MMATSRSMPNDTFLSETLLVIQYANTHSYLVSSEPYLTKLDQHIRDLKAFGLWNKFDLLYWMVGDGDMDFKTINIIDPSKYKGVLNGGLTNTIQGIEGNGIDAYVDTNFNPSIGSNKYVETDAGRCMYVYKQSSIGSTVRRTLDGIAANSFRNYTTNINNIQQQINSNANVNVAPSFSGLGYTSINRISNIDVLMYKEENQYTATVISDGVYSSNQIIFAKGSVFGDNGLSSYSIGASLTGQNAIDYRNAIITGVNQDVDPPTIIFDDMLRTLTASHPLGNSEILFSINDATYEQYLGPIEIGRASLAAGYYKFKTKAAAGRNESPVVDSPEIPRDTFLPETQSIIEYANNHSYFVSSELYLINLDKHIRDLKAFGLWGKFDLLYWMVGDGDMDFKTINIIDPSKYKGTLIGGLLNTLKGIEGNAVDGYVNTNFNPSIGINKYMETNSGRYTYVYKASTFGTTVRSTVDGVIGNAFRNFLTNNDTVNQRINCSGNIDIAPSLSGDGYTSINRTSSTHVIMYKEENQFLASAVSDGLYNANQIIYAKSGNFGDNGLSCYGMGEALTGQDQVNYRLSIINNNATFLPFIPDPPTVIGDVETRLLIATSQYESGAILYSINSGSFIQYEGPINVGNDLVPEGTYKFKIKARLGRNESTVVDSPEIPEDTFLPETLSVIEYADNHSYQVSSQFYLLKLDKYIRDLKASGLWDKFDLLYWFVGDGDMDFKTINIVASDSYKGTVTELFNTSRGIRGTGMGIIQTHFNPALAASNYTQNNAGRGLYVYANDFVNVGTSIVDGIENNASFNMLKTRSGTDSRINSLNNLSTATNLTGSDYLGINRIDANTVILYQGLNEYIDGTNPSTSIFFDANCTILGASTVRGGNAISCYWIGSPIVDGDATNLRQIILDNKDIVPNVSTNAPTVIRDEIARTLTATSEYGDSEIVVSTSFQPFQKYTGAINVGNGPVTSNFYRFRIKESIGYEESPIVNGGSFPEVPDEVPAPTNGIVDDVNNTFDFTFAPGYPHLSDYYYSLNGGAFWQIVQSKPIQLPNENIEIGFVIVKTVDRVIPDESTTLYNLEPYTKNIVEKTTPAKPTGVSGNVANRNFTFTVAPGLTLDDYEYCRSYVEAEAWTLIDSNPQPLMNVWAMPMNDVAIRVRGNDTRNPSEPSFVPVAYPQQQRPTVAPIVQANNELKIIMVKHPLGIRRVATKIGLGAYNTIPFAVEVPNDNLSAGQYKFRYNNSREVDVGASETADSPAFTKTILTPLAPTLIANDVGNTISAWHPLGNSEILVSTNNGAYTAYSGIIHVGNVDRPVGYYKFKTKSATNRNESPITESPVFTADTIDESEFPYTLNLTL